MATFTAGIRPRGIPESASPLDLVQIQRPTDGLLCSVGRFTGEFSLGAGSRFDRVRKDFIYWAYGIGSDTQVVIKTFTGRNIAQADKIMREAHDMAAKWPVTSVERGLGVTL